LYKGLYLKRWRSHYINKYRCDDTKQFDNIDHIRQLTVEKENYQTILVQHQAARENLLEEYNSLSHLHTKKIKLMSLFHIPIQSVHIRHDYEDKLNNLESKIFDNTERIKYLNKKLSRENDKALEMRDEHNMKLQSSTNKLIKWLGNGKKLFPLVCKAYEIVLTDNTPLPPNSDSTHGMISIKVFLETYGTLNKNYIKDIFIYPDRQSVNSIVANHGLWINIHNENNNYVMYWLDFKHQTIYCIGIPHFVYKSISIDNICTCYRVPSNWLSLSMADNKLNLDESSQSSNSNSSTSSSNFDNSSTASTNSTCSSSSSSSNSDNSEGRNNSDSESSNRDSMTY
jgi:hypothetical protein